MDDVVHIGSGRMRPVYNPCTGGAMCISEPAVINLAGLSAHCSTTWFMQQTFTPPVVATPFLVYAFTDTSTVQLRLCALNHVFCDCKRSSLEHSLGIRYVSGEAATATRDHVQPCQVTLAPRHRGTEGDADPVSNDRRDPVFTTLISIEWGSFYRTCPDQERG